MHKIVLPERTQEKDCAQIGIPREREQQRSAEKEILEIIGISERTQIVGAPMPQTATETLGVLGLAPRERVQLQTVDAPTPQVLEETVEVGRSVSHERVQQRTAEQFEDAPQSPAEVVEAVSVVPHESEGAAGGMSERHWLVTLGVWFRRWTWTNTTIAIARKRRKRE